MVYTTRPIVNQQLLIDYGEFYWQGTLERKYRRRLEMCVTKQGDKIHHLERRLTDYHNHGVDNNAAAAQAQSDEENAELRRQVAELSKIAKVGAVQVDSIKTRVESANGFSA